MSGDDLKVNGLTVLGALAGRDPQFKEASAVYDMVQTLSSGLKRMRLRHQLSQGGLANRLGVSQGRISQIESGLVDHAPSLDMAVRYATACGERLDIRFSGEERDRVHPVQAQMSRDPQPANTDPAAQAYDMLDVGAFEPEVNIVFGHGLANCDPNWQWGSVVPQGPAFFKVLTDALQTAAIAHSGDVAVQACVATGVVEASAQRDAAGQTGDAQGVVSGMTIRMTGRAATDVATAVGNAVVKASEPA